MYSWGWVVKPDGRGNFGKTSNYEVRDFDGEDWVEGESEIVSPISFSTFLAFWEAHHPKLKIRSPAYDTCTLCFKYSCSLSSLFRAANEAGIEIDDVVLGDMNLDDK